jgi:hypothetical protein
LDQQAQSNNIGRKSLVGPGAQRYARKMSKKSINGRNSVGNNLDIQRLGKKFNSLQKYVIYRHSPAYTFLPIKVSALAPSTTPSSNLPVRNIWDYLVMQEVSFSTFIILTIF